MRPGDTLILDAPIKGKPFTFHFTNSDGTTCESYTFPPEALPLLVSTNTKNEPTKKHWWSR